jgi:hypothetical protein
VALILCSLELSEGRRRRHCSALGLANCRAPAGRSQFSIHQEHFSCQFVKPRRSLPALTLGPGRAYDLRTSCPFRGGGRELASECGRLPRADDRIQGNVHIASTNAWDRPVDAAHRTLTLLTGIPELSRLTLLCTQDVEHALGRLLPSSPSFLCRPLTACGYLGGVAHPSMLPHTVLILSRTYSARSSVLSTRSWDGRIQRY